MRFRCAAVFLVFDLPPPVEDALRVLFPSWRPAGADDLDQYELVALVAIHVGKRAGGSIRPAYAGEDAEGIHAPILEHPVLLFDEDGVGFVDIGVILVGFESQLKIILGRDILNVLHEMLRRCVRRLVGNGTRRQSSGIGGEEPEVGGQVSKARVEIRALVWAGLAEDIILHPAANPHHCIVQGVVEVLVVIIFCLGTNPRHPHSHGRDRNARRGGRRE